jgi:hypothetical protein
MSSLLCGGLFAAYVGWQMVRDEVASTPPGSIDRLAAPAQAQTSLQPQTYIIVTATSDPQGAAIAQAPQQGLVEAVQRPSTSNAIGPTPVYPAAVEATATPTGGPQQPPPSLQEIAQETNATALLPQSAATPILDFGLEVPTRRPTPFLDIPTSTPVIDATATPPPTATPMPPLGTPMVIFYAEDPIMDQGDCTNLHWHVENVKEVYYENIGVDGRGQKEECIRDDDPGNYRLMVILQNGATQWYTVTVGVLLPTDTPAPTPTRTPQPVPTATWTPNLPTPTPTPQTTYGARLVAGDDPDISCERGSTCELDLYASNTGNAIDNITVRFTEASSWPRQLCRLDGVCSENQITLVNMGVSNSGVVRLSISVPADAASETMSYRVQAVSDNSGGDTTSANITIKITAADGAAE